VLIVFKKRCQQYHQLNGDERGLLWKSVILLPLIHTALSFWGFPRFYQFLENRVPLRKNGSLKNESEIIIQAHQIAKMVSIAARYGLVRATCLRRSLLIWYYLRCRGITSSIIFGVRKISGKLDAHAWVEINGIVVSERDDTHIQYHPMGSAMPPTRQGL
jgi:hypothetical protein